VKSPEQNESAGAQGQESQAPVLVNVPLDFELKGLDADHPYLLKRGFTPETIRHFGLGYCTRGAFKGRLAIPIRDGDGALVGYAGRLTKDEEVSDANPKYKFPAARERDGAIHRFDKSLLLYNAHALEKPTQCVIVVQGFSSVWWLWQHGYRCTVALMGPECSEAQAVFLKQRLSANGHVWVLTDGDELGDRCAGEVFRKVGDLRPVRYVALRRGERPSDCSVEDLSALLGG
jgi:DNA primase